MGFRRGAGVFSLKPTGGLELAAVGFNLIMPKRPKIGFWGVYDYGLTLQGPLENIIRKLFRRFDRICRFGEG